MRTGESNGLSGARVLAVVLGVAGAAACAIGSSLPWVKYSLPGPFRLVPNVVFSGLNYPSGDSKPIGNVSLAAGVSSGVFLVLAQLPRARVLAAFSIAAALISGGAAWDFRQNLSLANYIGQRLSIRSLGPGTGVVLIGATALFAASIGTLIGRRSNVVPIATTKPSSLSNRANGRRYSIPVPDLSPNWLPDPSRRYEFRFWDGGCWTDRVASHGDEQQDQRLLSESPPDW